MLELLIPKTRLWDQKANNGNGEFVYSQECRIKLEHSLVSVAKWESKYHKPFLDDKDKTNEELLYYIKCMTITQNVKDIVYLALTKEHTKQITDYISNKMTATWFSDEKQKPGNKVGNKKETKTSELIYYWMISHQIPFECQKWHLNRLLTLIKVCNAKQKAANSTKGGKHKRDLLRENYNINAARRKAMNTTG